MSRNPKRRPTHPGALLREDILPAAGITQTELAERMGVSRLTVSEILHEKRAVTADIAHRLGRVFGNGPELWLNMQKAVDLWEALEKNKREYERIETLQVALS
ncbi:MAG TPA: HigA family addiction module antitoxin [Blastocatellia bacterium]|jgi:addiction module HigA family antidote|nr:HigA family addiction module antitoxin [Blastocatellia bacterium]